MNDLIDVCSRVVAALDRVGIPYSVGGSLASSFSGEPRASLDADILVDLTAAQVGPFVQAIGDEFYVDPDALQRGVERRATANLIHHASGIKVDLFFSGSLLERRQLERRRRVRIAANPDREWFVHSPEDILLQKLAWYRQGGEVSDRQWRDVIGIVLVQGQRLDRDYVTTTAAQSGLADLLERALHEGQEPSA